MHASEKSLVGNLSYLNFFEKKISQADNDIKQICQKIEEKYYSLLPSQRTSILQIFEKYPAAKQYLSDFVFVRKSQSHFFKRIYLANASPYFFDLLSGGRWAKIELGHISKAAYEIFIEYLSNGTIPKIRKKKNIRDLLSLASRWGLQGLLKELPEKCFLNGLKSSLYVYLSAQEHQHKELKKKALQGIVQHLSENEVGTVIEIAEKSKLIDIQAFIFKLFKHKYKEGLQLEESRRIMHSLLSRFNFSNRRLAKLKTDQLAYVLRMQPERVKYLNLADRRDVEIEELARFLTPHITNLNLCGTRLTSKTFAEIVKRCDQLRSLNLAHAMQWTGVPVNKWACLEWKEFSKLKNLIKLDVTECVEAHRDLLRVIQASPGLRELRAGYACHYPLMEQLGDQIVKSLYLSCPHVETLVLPNLSVSTLELCNLGNLKTLVLHQGHLNGKNLVALIQGLPNLKRLALTLTDPERNFLIKELLPFLNHIEELTIKVAYQNFKNGMPPVRLNGAYTNLHLRKLHLDAPLTKELCKDLICNCSNITHLTIRENQSSNISNCNNQEMIQELIASPIELKSLEYNGLINECQLMAISDRWPKLKILKLKRMDAKITEEAFEKVFSQLKHLKVLKLSFAPFLNRNLNVFFKVLGSCCVELEKLCLSVRHSAEKSDIRSLCNLTNLVALQMDLLCPEECILELLPSLPKLKKLKFFCKEWSDYLFDQIIKQKPNLESLSIKAEYSGIDNHETLKKIYQMAFLKELEIPFHFSFIKNGYMQNQFPSSPQLSPFNPRLKKVIISQNV